jgi:uncharacterized integral membrane protein (TIGR00698 family)
MTMPSLWRTLSLGRRFTEIHLPGVLVCAVIALAATFLSEHYGGPQLLYALLIGLSLHFLSTNPGINSGINLCAKTVLRLGVTLLGVRITVSQVVDLGLNTALLVVAAVTFTIALGLVLARWLNRPANEGLLSGAAVGICGASAAMAIFSVLPQTKENERFTLLMVVGVTVLSTLAMVLYPFALHLIGLNATQSGIVLGGTIHDVAQVIAAGMMLGQEAGDAAIVVKLFRVMMLLPVVMLISIVYSKNTLQSPSDPSCLSAVKQPLVPHFIYGFVLLVLLGSLGFFPLAATQWASDASRGCLVMAIAAAGVKTSFEDLLKLGWQPALMLIAETTFIALFVMAGVLLLGLGLSL